MANYPQELAQDAAYQSHTSRLTELCSLPKPAQGLNTYNNTYSKQQLHSKHLKVIHSLFMCIWWLLQLLDSTSF